jgi:hypothetical protein
MFENIFPSKMTSLKFPLTLNFDCFYLHLLVQTTHMVLGFLYQMIVLRDSIYASCIWTYLTVNKQG